MRLVARCLLCALTVAAALAPRMPRADGAEATLRIAVVVPGGAAETVAAEVSAGIALAVLASNDAKAGGAKRPAVEVVQFDAGDPAIAALAVDKAAKEKCLAAIALAADGVAANLEVVARKAKFPLVLVGPGGSIRTLDPADPVLRVDPSPADRGLAIAELLRLRSGRSSIGLPAQTKRAWLVVEDVPWAHAVAASVRADDVDGLVAPGDAVVRTGEEPDAAATAKARADGCDRVVVLGGTRMLRAAFAALDKAAWDVAVVAVDAALDGTPVATKEGARRKAAFVAATPAWIEERRLDDVLAKHPLPAGRPAALTPAAARGFVAAAALIDAAVLGTKKGLVACLRDLREGSGAREWPLFDPAGCADHWRYGTWVTGEGGAVAPVKAAFLPDAALGPLLGGRPGARYRALAGATCVRVGFGGGGGPEPTIDSDLATLGMGKRAGAVYDMARDQILARTCGKLSRLWSKSYDGSPRAALSFKIAFVPEGADTTGASAVWSAAIAGDGPDGLHGGQSFPKEHRAQALSTYLLRNAALLHAATLKPPLAASDATYLDGSYAWNSDADGNARSDKIRALIDGVASTFCMKLSKEIGHLAGLSVDNSGEPRSVMVAKGGEGVSDEFAYFPPAFAKVLERTLGRVGTEGK